MTFAVGDVVVVSDREHEGHHRTPGYLKGKRGSIASVHGTFSNPETRAYGDTGLPEQRLYLVEFPGHEVWSSGNGRLYADIFEHWLEKAS
jgi:nitrile hydratase subunit beta